MKMNRRTASRIIFGSMLLIYGGMLESCRKDGKVEPLRSGSPQATSLIKTLRGVSADNAVPPFAKADAGFPGAVIEHISKGKIKVLVSSEKLNAYAAYSFDHNTIIFFEHYKLESRFAELVKAHASVHESYHAYQDLLGVPRTRNSEIEGPAYLVSLKYLLFALGHRMPGPAANRALAEFVKETGHHLLYSEYNPQRLDTLVRAALTEDRRVWEKGCQEIGRFSVRYALYDNVAKVVDQLVISQALLIKEKQDPASVELSPDNKIELSAEQVTKLFQLRERAVSAKINKDAFQVRKAHLASIDYWVDEVCPQFERQIDLADKYLAP